MQSIYVSSLAFRQLSIPEIATRAKDNEFAIEFTSNIPYYPSIVDDYGKADIKKMAHNYFPTPEFPFVLNLASVDMTIRRRSIQHCLQGLRLCKDSNAPFFAAHAGFCVDPKPNELGKKFASTQAVNRQDHISVFIESLREITAMAESLELPFLFENNVLIKENVLPAGVNPLLCCESAEIKAILEEVDSNFLGFLLDTAHLKISCATLNLNKDEEVSALGSSVTAIHHSDNNGLVDNNRKLAQDYWFLKHLPHYKDCVQVIEVGDLTINEMSQHINLLKDYGSK